MSAEGLFLFGSPKWSLVKKKVAPTTMKMGNKCPERLILSKQTAANSNNICREPQKVSFDKIKLSPQKVYDKSQYNYFE